MGTHEVIRITNFYNPCKELSNNILEEVMGDIQGKLYGVWQIIWILMLIMV